MPAMFGDNFHDSCIVVTAVFIADETAFTQWGIIRPVGLMVPPFPGGTIMAATKNLSDLTKAIVKLDNRHGYRCDQYFAWLIDDVLAGFGIKALEIPPEEVIPDIFELGGLYAPQVIQTAPFEDVLGEVYMELASQWKQKSLGQFFTPWPVSSMMARMIIGNELELSEDRLRRIIDPCCGGGIMLLAAAHHIMTLHNPEALRSISLTGIDLDRICARLTPCHLLANCYVHQVDLGELLVYRGNALGDLDRLEVVVHATRKDLNPAEYVPAKFKAREVAIQSAAKYVSRGQLQLDF